MDAFERRIAVLLHEAVPQPHQDVSVREIERLGRRRRAVAVASPVVALLLIAAVVVGALTIGRKPDKSVPPATRTATLNLSGISVRYPADWRHAVLDTDPGFTGGRAQDDPSAFLTSGAVTTVCQPMAPSGRFCQKGVARLAADQLYVGYNNFTPPLPDSLDLTLDAKVAGRPASVTEMANVSLSCPTGTASTTDVVVKLRTGRYLSIVGCLGRAPAAAKAFQRLLDSARYTG